MTQENAKTNVLSVANLFGIRGIVAILSEWAKNEGGLSFVIKCITHMNQDDVNHILEHWDKVYKI